MPFPVVDMTNITRESDKREVCAGGECQVKLHCEEWMDDNTTGSYASMLSTQVSKRLCCMCREITSAVSCAVPVSDAYKTTIRGRSSIEILVTVTALRSCHTLLDFFEMAAQHNLDDPRRHVRYKPEHIEAVNNYLLHMAYSSLTRSPHRSRAQTSQVMVKRTCTSGISRLSIRFGNCSLSQSLL